MGEPAEYHGPVSLLQQGDEVPLFPGVALQVMATPGHNPSCLSFVVGDYLFTGDSYIPGTKVVTNLPWANKLEALQSEALLRQWEDRKIICPGH